MRHTTPLAAFETLEREVAALAEDATRPGGMLAERLETILTLVPVLGAAALEPAYAADRAATIAALERMQAGQEALTGVLRMEMGRIREELGQISAGTAANRSYGAAPAGRPALQLDTVG